MRPPCRLVALVALLAVALVACGDVGDGEAAALEESVAGAVRDRLAADAPLVGLRAVACDEAGAAAACVVDLDVASQESVVRVAYDVQVDAAGCWTARPVAVEQLGAGAGVEPDAQGIDGRLAGCVG